MGDVVTWRGITRLAIPPERVLNGALKKKFKEVLVIGYEEDGTYYFAASEPDGPAALWLLEQTKLNLFRVTTED